MWKLSGKFHFFLLFCTRKRSKTYSFGELKDQTHYSVMFVGTVFSLSFCVKRDERWGSWKFTKTDLHLLKGVKGPTRRYLQGIQKLVSTYLLGAQFAGGVVFWASENWKGVGGVFSGGQNWKVLKCQDLPKFQFPGGGGVFFGGQNWKVLKCQDLPKF